MSNELPIALRLHGSVTPVIGDHVEVHRGVEIDISGLVTIGDHCVIGDNVRIHSHKHALWDVWNQGLVEPAPVTIGPRVWIQTGAQILGGVTIGEGAVVLAGAVVTKDVEPYTAVGGVPAVVVARKGDGNAE